MPKRTPTRPSPDDVVTRKIENPIAAAPLAPKHFDGVPVISEEEALKRGFVPYHQNTTAPLGPVVDMVALVQTERASCAAFVESLTDVGSESVRSAIAKALRERQ